MRRLLLALLVSIFSLTNLSAEEKVINQSNLPQKAKTFLAAHYTTHKISIATEERGFFDKDYKVILTNGTKLEFDGDGNWTEIECKNNSNIPLTLAPEKIAKYIKASFPSNTIKKIEKNKKFIEVELNNDIELEFNSNGDLVRVDS